MSVGGHIYGVILNDRDELERLSPQFGDKPYLAPPQAPVVYMKPRSALRSGHVPHSVEDLVCAPTLALLMARDATRRTVRDSILCIGAVALALDISLAEVNYYRPAVGQRNADGFLALGEWQVPCWPRHIRTFSDNVEAHAWELERLARSPMELVAALSQFMTLRAGDVLLVGLPGDAPVATERQRLRVEAPGLPDLHVRISEAAT